MRKMKKPNLVGLGLLVLMILAGASTSLAELSGFLEASRKGDLKRVQQLVDSGTNVNELDKTGFTALHWAAMTNKIEVAKFLIKKGADVNIRDSKMFMSPLDVAHAKGFKDMAELLLKNGAKP
jgi:ankyrin repeat protein